MSVELLDTPGQSRFDDFSRHIAVLVWRALAALNVLLVDKNLDALLDHADAGVEPGFGLVDDLWPWRGKENQLMIKEKKISQDWKRLYCMAKSEFVICESEWKEPPYTSAVS